MATLSLPKVPAPLISVLAFALLPACDSRAVAPADALEVGAPLLVGAPVLVAEPLLVTEPVAEFGRVFEGALVEHEWALSVRQPVVIRTAKTDCGCTLAQLERSGPAGREPYALEEPLAGGDVLFVHVRYDTRGRRGPAARAVTLTTSAGAVLALALAVDVQPWLVVEPAAFAFARVRVGEGAQREFQVRSESGEAFGLAATARALPPWVRVEIEAHQPDDAGRARLWTGRVRLGSDAPTGTFSYPIELVSDVRIDAVPIDALRSDAREPGLSAGREPRRHSATPSWTLQVMGVVTLSAPTLEFGLVRADETVSRSVRLESLQPGFVPGAAKARLEPMRPDEPFLLGRTAEVRTRLVGQACEIELILAGLDPGVQGNFLARLVIETGHPELPVLEAVVRGVRVPDGETR